MTNRARGIPLSTLRAAQYEGVAQDEGDLRERSVFRRRLSTRLPGRPRVLHAAALPRYGV
jgi:hypothetical protein